MRQLLRRGCQLIDSSCPGRQQLQLPQQQQLFGHPFHLLALAHYTTLAAQVQPCRSYVPRRRRERSSSTLEDGAAATASTRRPLRVCVVGAGPSGLYCVERLLKLFPFAAQTLSVDVEVDIIDRLPTPFGLVRSGVAPDHYPTKAVTKKFQNMMEDPRLRFFGNLRVGKHVQVKDLREMYDALILAYGTEGDNSFGGLPGVCWHLVSSFEGAWLCISFSCSLDSQVRVLGDALAIYSERLMLQVKRAFGIF